MTWDVEDEDVLNSERRILGAARMLHACGWRVDRVAQVLERMAKEARELWQGKSSAVIDLRLVVHDGHLNDRRWTQEEKIS
jgi:hypothetical protein